VATRTTSGRPIERVAVSAYRVPLPEPESDGTAEWSATEVVVVEAAAGPHTGVGYAYAPPAAASVVAETLAAVAVGNDVLATGAVHASMERAVRNQGRAGVAAGAISAVDVALWDLKAKVLDISVADAVGRCHRAVPVYGSGGFTSLIEPELREQLGGWAAEGLRAVKMKVGRDHRADPARVEAARKAIGERTQLFVDANGGYTRGQARAMAQVFADLDVTWFEEPVTSDDLDGLRLVRDTGPAGMDVAAGEYGYTLRYFERMASAGAVDCLQADVTRCGGITSFLAVAAVADAHGLELSSHTAPHVSAHACAGVRNLRHLEWFADHVRAEQLLFDGVLVPRDGVLCPEDRPGLGIELKRADAEAYRR
jgi:L-alanine-DL-glutamate epimerase-like enolase superfamily enzyme